MDTLLIALASFVGFIVAYHSYGRWLSRRIFGLDASTLTPSHEMRDDVDYVPTHKQVIFGHHFTSIAGTGPIVGPAIAVFWGWLPALLWVVFGCIFIGAVHDLGTLVVSLRNRGQTVGEIAGRVISPRAKILFLLVLFFSLSVVLAIFGLVIANIFSNYPETVLSVWIAMPIAMAIGYWTYRRHGKLLVPSLVSLVVLYAAIYVGVEYLPISVTQSADTQATAWSGRVDLQVGSTTIASALPLVNPVVAWTVVLMVYCFIASVLPVWLLLQPRDYINSHQLLVALVLLVAGLAVAGISGRAQLQTTTPSRVASAELPEHTPPIFPFLFITIACGACSGFHCLVSSGTSSKQVDNECDAQYVAYGSMLLEGALAVIVILACTAGVGMGLFTKSSDGRYVAMQDASNQAIVGHAAWRERYKQDGDWSKFGLKDTVGAFVEGGANFLGSLGLPLRFGVGIIATLVACFAATTLDTATRLQRYVIQELGTSFKISPLENKYGATSVAVILGLALAVSRGPNGQPGFGGLVLWPLFGATNQLLAGLAFMVVTFYLWRRQKPIWIVAFPMVMMLLMPAWALSLQLFGPEGWLVSKSWVLFGFGIVTLALQIWMVAEGLMIWPKARGMLEEALPPLTQCDV
ncbi:MAG: carbon starvation protein A [Pirellulaceae bacterium]